MGNTKIKSFNDFFCFQTRFLSDPILLKEQKFAAQIHTPNLRSIFFVKSQGVTLKSSHLTIFFSFVGTSWCISTSRNRANQTETEVDCWRSESNRWWRNESPIIRHSRHCHNSGSSSAYKKTYALERNRWCGKTFCLTRKTSALKVRNEHYRAATVKFWLARPATLETCRCCRLFILLNPDEGLASHGGPEQNKCANSNLSFFRLFNLSTSRVQR